MVPASEKIGAGFACFAWNIVVYLCPFIYHLVLAFIVLALLDFFESGVADTFLQLPMSIEEILEHGDL